MHKYRLSPFEIPAALWRHRSLILTMTRRDIAGRYRGSVFGIVWSFFTPLLMLVVYTFVFGIVFKARWGIENESMLEFALILFLSLIVFNVFAETVIRAPVMILGHANFVKRVVFPLEILPVVVLCSALFNAFMSLAVWLVFSLIFSGAPPLTALLFPALLLPLVLMTAGLAWFLSALGVYVRDVSQIVGVITTALMFLAPIFYPVERLPSETLRTLVRVNPLTLVIEQARNAAVFGKLPNPAEYAACLLGAIVIACLGFAWFQKTRKGFADVI